MSLRESEGNMYPWVTHVHSHLRGACPHKCSYCYVQRGRARKFYQGPVRLETRELTVRYGGGKTIFIEHCHDLFARDVPDEYRRRILAHCNCWPENTFLFQTKNPEWMLGWQREMPPVHMLGVTIETDIDYVCAAPSVTERLKHAWRQTMFITVEPVMRFTSDFAHELIAAMPSFVNIGADSKRCGLPEPTEEELRQLIAKLRDAGIDVRLKSNLGRLMQQGGELP